MTRTGFNNANRRSCADRGGEKMRRSDGAGNRRNPEVPRGQAKTSGTTLKTGVNPLLLNLKSFMAKRERNKVYKKGRLFN